jgi:hypothetical protein
MKIKEPAGINTLNQPVRPGQQQLSPVVCRKLLPKKLFGFEVPT